jgi:multiple sugar transport system permease protein
MLLNATQSHADLGAKLNILPGRSFLHNYIALKGYMNIWQNLRNSLIVTIPGVLLTAYFGTLAAYGFEKFDFSCKGLLFGICMAMMIIPPQISLIGLYQIYSKIKLLNTYWSCFLPSIANVLTVYWMRGHIYQVIDDAIIESATIDGCSAFVIFNRIILPLCKTGIMTISIMNFVSLWNDFIHPLTFITNKKMYTLPVAIANMRSQNFVDLGASYMAVFISTLVIVIIYILFNSQIIGNIAEGGVKG